MHTFLIDFIFRCCKKDKSTASIYVRIPGDGDLWHMHKHSALIFKLGGKIFSYTLLQLCRNLRTGCKCPVDGFSPYYNA